MLVMWRNKAKIKFLQEERAMLIKTLDTLEKKIKQQDALFRRLENRLFGGNFSLHPGDIGEINKRLDKLKDEVNMCIDFRIDVMQWLGIEYKTRKSPYLDFRHHRFEEFNNESS